MEGIWGFVIIGGPIVLGLGLLWALAHNRGSRREIERTEQATRKMYEEQGREDATRR